MYKLYKDFEKVSEHKTFTELIKALRQLHKTKEDTKLISIVVTNNNTTQ